MPDPTYLYTARQCPLPQVPLAALYAGSSPPTPVVGTAVTSSSSAAAQSLPTLINADQVRGNLLARHGGGFYAVVTGLELSAGAGLLLNIGTGIAMLDGPAENRTAATLAQTDGLFNRNWISRAGTINKVTSASASPLAPPDGSSPWCYLGGAQTAGSITSVDYSGRFTLQGNLALRRTADLAEPDDADLLPSGVRFLTRTLGGLYLWDGTEYTQLDGVAETLSDSLASLTSDLDELWMAFRRQLQWTAQMLGQDFVHPDLYGELDRA